MYARMDIASCIINNRLHVKVKPGARVSKVMSIEDSIVHLAIAAQPEDGKANAEVEKFLTRLLKKKARIKSGFTSKEKIVILA